MALVVCTAALGACGGESLHHSGAHGSSGTSGSSGDSSASGGSSAGTGGTSGLAMGGACDKEPLPSAGAPPSEVGCYGAENGTTWVRIPCNCELLLENTGREDAEATITLSVAPATSPPLGSELAELDFPDPDYEFFDVWTRQVGSATTISVSWADGVTTVGLNVPSIALDPVPLRACESRPGTARYSGPLMTSLEMEAVVTGPESSARLEGECQNIPHPTPAP
jgi:hypothetical protein